RWQHKHNVSFGRRLRDRPINSYWLTICSVNPQPDRTHGPHPRNAGQAPCQTQNYLRIVQRYLRMVENFAMLHYSLLQRAPPENHCVLMAASLKLLPGSTVRWRDRRYLIVDYQSLDAIIARQPGKRRLERIPVNEAAPDHASHIVSGGTP